MENLVIYLLKSGMITAVFYGIYWCFLKNETFYRFNRYFLLTGILCAFLLPFFKYSYNVTITLPAGIDHHAEVASSNKAANTVPAWLDYTIIIYGLVAVFLMSRHIAGLIKIKKMIVSYGYTLLQGYKVITTPVFKSSFSVFNYIFIDISSGTSEIEKNLIIEHELAHVKQYHWADLLISQLTCALQWFNPFAWLYLHAIKENHEFMADEAVLQKGNSPAVYRAALINHSLQTTVFMFASSFAHYDKFKRINMMMKPGSSPVKKLAVLIVLPAFALFLFAFAEPKFNVVLTKKKQNDQQRALNSQESLPAETILHAPDQTNASQAAQGRNLTENPVKQHANTMPEKKNIIPSTIKKSASAHFSNALRPDSSATEKTTVSVSGNKMTILKNTRQVPASAYPIVFLDGVQVASTDVIKSDDIQSINVYKGKMAIEKYGEKGENGVIEVHSKKQLKKTE